MSFKGEVLTSPPQRVDLGQRGMEFQRADIVFHGVEQAGPSFEARVFLNNPGATQATPQDPGHGYAGSFHVYGYGGAPPAAGPTAQRHDGARVPMTRYVVATEALRQALGAGQEVVVTVVIVPPGQGPGAVLPAGSGVSIDPRRIAIQVDQPPPGSQEM